MMASRHRTEVDTSAARVRERLPADYQSWSASRKVRLLWEEKLLASEYEELGPIELRPFPPTRAFMRESFEVESDEQPEGRARTLHPKGSVVSIELVPASRAHSYTGLLKGAPHALARLSLGVPPVWPLGFIPGLGLKIFIDGHPSANLHVMHSIDGQGDNHNFFEFAFSNILPRTRRPLFLLGEAIFRLGKADPYTLGLGHLATRDAAGNSEPEPRAPERLVFEPGPAVGSRKDRYSKEDLREKLSRIRSGTLLYTVHALESGSAKWTPIWKMITRSRFCASWWGDERLFFRHQD